MAATTCHRRHRSDGATMVVSKSAGGLWEKLARPPPPPQLAEPRI